jgi:hypothetical protein
MVAALFLSIALPHHGSHGARPLPLLSVLSSHCRRCCAVNVLQALPILYSHETLLPFLPESSSSDASLPPPQPPSAPASSISRVLRAVSSSGGGDGVCVTGCNWGGAYVTGSRLAQPSH